MSGSSNGQWRAVTKREPCPACGGADWCAWTPEGDVLRCMRPGDAPNGMRKLGDDADGGTRYGPVNGSAGSSGYRLPKPPPRKAKPAGVNKLDLPATLERLRSQLTDERLAELASSTGLPGEAWAKLRPGWCEAADLRQLKAGGAGWVEPGPYPEGAYAFAEHDGRGKLVGLSLRAVDGRKGFPSGAVGCKRGLIVPPGLHKLIEACRPSEEVVSDGSPACGPLVVEGASDVAACVALGLPAVGRPSNITGAGDLADLLDGVDDVLIVGERDAKEGGAWPGRDGAKKVAEQLAGRWGEPVVWTLPPEGSKDVRAWYGCHAGEGAAALVEALKAATKKAKARKRSIADALVELALKRYRLGVTDTGEAFAVEREGPTVALMFRGGASALRAKLARAYRAATGKTPNASALADALVGLEGHALDADPEPVSLRLAEAESDAGAGVVLDLGDAGGTAAVIGGDGVKVVSESPTLFRRTALTGPLPTPAEDVSDPAVLNGLRDLLNVGDDAWPLVVGWLVASMIPSIPHPVLMLGGEQGTG